MTIRNSSRSIARVFRALLRLDAVTPRLRLWPTVRWGALHIEFSSQ